MPIDPFVKMARDEQDREFVSEFITTQRTEDAAESAVAAEPHVEPTDIKVTGNGVEPDGSLSEAEFEGFRDALSTEPGFQSRGSRRFVVKDRDALDAPNPVEVTQSRSEAAVEQDREMRARVTTDVSQYASDPDSYDFPFVDTPPEFNERFEEENPLLGDGINKTAFREARESGFDF